MHLTICLFSTWPYKSKIWRSILASKRSFSRVYEIVCYLQSPWNRSEIISQYLSPSLSSMRPAPVATTFLITRGSAFEKGQIQFQSPYFDQHHHEDIHLLYLSYVHISYCAVIVGSNFLLTCMLFVLLMCGSNLGQLGQWYEVSCLSRLAPTSLPCRRMLSLCSALANVILAQCNLQIQYCEKGIY